MAYSDSSKGLEEIFETLCNESHLLSTRAAGVQTRKRPTEISKGFLLTSFWPEHSCQKLSLAFPWIETQVSQQGRTFARLQFDRPPLPFHERVAQPVQFQCFHEPSLSLKLVEAAATASYSLCDELYK